MASKVGWTHMHPEGKLASIWLEATKSESFLRRICVRVDDCPETIKRSELAATVKRGWEVQIPTWPSFGDCLYIESSTRFVTFVDSDGQLCETGVDDITAIRQNPEAPWTKVVEG